MSKLGPGSKPGASASLNTGSRAGGGAMGGSIESWENEVYCAQQMTNIIHNVTGGNV